MTVSIFIPMFTYMVISSYTPGPGNILALNTMISSGWKKGRSLLFGIMAGYFTVQMICTLALYGVSTYLSSALNILKYVGAVYLIWLAIHIIRSKPLQNQNERGKSTFFTGYVMQLVNVKIYFYITTLLISYIIPVFSELKQQIFMGVFVVAVGSSATLCWAFLGLRLQHAYTKHYKFINILLSAFLIYCAINIIRS